MYETCTLLIRLAMQYATVRLTITIAILMMMTKYKRYHVVI